jgi:Fe-S-cluster containining protein
VTGPTSTIRLMDYLPPIYERLLPALFDREIPVETRATCEDCAMCSDVSGAPSELGLKSFHPDRKCCTYYPSLPNYLVGALLSSQDPELAEGRARVRARIRQGDGISPRGVVMPRKFAVLYENGAEFFGRTGTLLCPYLDDGKCSIWKYREAVCSTYFCKYVKGARGREFWGDLKSYLSHIESRLSLLVITQVERDEAQLDRWWEEWQQRAPLSLEEIDGLRPNEDTYRAKWGKWAGDEEAFYRACYEQLQKLTAADVEKASGIEETYLRQRLERKLDLNATDVIPKRLKRNSELVVVKHQGNYLLTSPLHKADVFELSPLIYPVLDEFDGTRDWEEVCRDISETKKMVLPEPLIAKLYYLGALV